MSIVQDTRRVVVTGRGAAFTPVYGGNRIPAAKRPGPCECPTYRESDGKYYQKRPDNTPVPKLPKGLPAYPDWTSPSNVKRKLTAAQQRAEEQAVVNQLNSAYATFKRQCADWQRDHCFGLAKADEARRQESIEKRKQKVIAASEETGSVSIREAGGLSFENWLRQFHPEVSIYGIPKSMGVGT